VETHPVSPEGGKRSVTKESYSVFSSNQRKKLSNEGCPKIDSPTAYKRK
jgi:hypothetical protein